MGTPLGTEFEVLNNHSGESPFAARKANSSGSSRVKAWARSWGSEAMRDGIAYGPSGATLVRSEYFRFQPQGGDFSILRLTNRVRKGRHYKGLPSLACMIRNRRARGEGPILMFCPDQPEVESDSPRLATANDKPTAYAVFSFVFSTCR